MLLKIRKYLKLRDIFYEENGHERWGILKNNIIENESVAICKEKLTLKSGKKVLIFLLRRMKSTSFFLLIINYLLYPPELLKSAL